MENVCSREVLDLLNDLKSRVSPGHLFTIYWPGKILIPKEDEGLTKAEEKKQRKKEQEENDNAFKAIKGSEWSDGEPLLKALRNRIKKLELDFFESGLKINSFEAKLTSQMLCGSGIDHIKDVGMSLMFPYGMPYIPGSSIKGVLRSFAWLNLNDKDKIEFLFGNEPPTDGDSETTGRGGNSALSGHLIFFDSYPQQSKCMDIDILTPHHKGYFEGKNTPNDREDPIPIKYLVVKPGTPYVFQVVHRAVPTEYRGIFQCDKECEELVDDLFTNVISYMGFGAKTRIGYGLFEFKKGWKDEIKALEEGRGESKSRQEQLMREKEKRLKRQTFLESLPVAERRAREFVDEITFKAANEPPRAKVEKVLREVIEKAQDDPEFLKALGNILEKEIWGQPLKLNSQKKNPAKDYDYQVSLKIQDLKNGKLPGKN